MIPGFAVYIVIILDLFNWRVIEGKNIKNKWLQSNSNCNIPIYYFAYVT